MAQTALGFMGLPVGVLACWGTYVLLKNMWIKAEEKVNSEDVLDGDLLK